MATITILNHGTSNASGDDLVITRLKSLMHGVKNGSWRLNTGVGTIAQAMDRHYAPGWNTVGGILWAKGLNKNVEDSVTFVKVHCNHSGAANVQVNLAGHSRGSMTALKIAHRLQEEAETIGCRVNLFLIDPVPGNLGWVNSGMYKKIAIAGNVQNAYMILAENERRNAFKPYVDQMFLQDMATHQMDTIPGNHGGINALGAKKHQSADIVLHHAVTFLSEHGTAFTGAGAVTKTDPQLVELYAAIMLQFQEYKHQGRARKNLAFHVAVGGVSKGDRKLQVHNPNKYVGPLNVPNLEKNKFDSTPMLGMQQQVPSLEGLSKQSRFFANHDHKRVFRVVAPRASRYIEQLETNVNRQTLVDMVFDAQVDREVEGMGASGRSHYLRWKDALMGQG